MAEDRQTLNRNLAQMLKGGVIMDVTTPEQAKIAQDAGACAVGDRDRLHRRKRGALAGGRPLPHRQDGLQGAVRLWRARPRPAQARTPCARSRSRARRRVRARAPTRRRRRWRRADSAAPRAQDGRVRVACDSRRECEERRELRTGPPTRPRQAQRTQVRQAQSGLSAPPAPHPRSERCTPYTDRPRRRRA